jgi:hypothetical protein
MQLVRVPAFILFRRMRQYWAPPRSVPGQSAPGRYCCKSRKLQSDEFFAKTRSGEQSPIRVACLALRRSPVSFTRGDEVPHVFTRKPRLQPAEFLNASAKRLLQQNRHIANLPHFRLRGPVSGAAHTKRAGSDLPRLTKTRPHRAGDLYPRAAINVASRRDLTVKEIADEWYHFVGLVL